MQSCVVTLEPVPADIDETFTLFYTDETAPAGHSVDLPMEDEAWPEPIVGGAIDIGEAVAQQLAVALDPYPRAPGATLDPRYDADQEAGPARANPFAELARKRGSGQVH